MSRKLRSLYIGVNGFVFAAIIILWLLQAPLGYPYAVRGKLLQVGLAILSALFAMVIPVWMRIMAFSAYHRRGQKATFKDFMRFQSWTIISSALAFALAPMSFMFDINLWARYFVTFMAIYALYFSFPSDKKLSTDLRLFKLSNDGTMD